MSSNATALEQETSVVNAEQRPIALRQLAVH